VRFKRFACLLAVLPLLLLGVFATAASAASPQTGFLRLAHLSPNTPDVDVYLYSFGNPTAKVVLHHVGYGDVSTYQSVPTGQYTAAMRLTGAPATSPPVLSSSLGITAGHAYTVAGLGPKAGLRLQVLNDQTTAPAGKVLVRVIEASLVQHVVSVKFNGSTVIGSLAFSSVSPYQTVPPGTGTLSVTGGSDTVRSAVTLTAGSVHTIVVLDGTKGLVLDNLSDSAAASVGGTAVTMTVQPGDSLWSIASRYLGSGADWPAIYSANRGLIGANPNLIFAGVRLQVKG
jgi:nucleoid-associated protein YgaU